MSCLGSLEPLTGDQRISTAAAEARSINSMSRVICYAKKKERRKKKFSPSIVGKRNTRQWARELLLEATAPAQVVSATVLPCCLSPAGGHVPAEMSIVNVTLVASRRIHRGWYCNCAAADATVGLCTTVFASTALLLALAACQAYSLPPCISIQHRRRSAGMTEPRVTPETPFEPPAENVAVTALRLVGRWDVRHEAAACAEVMIYAKASVDTLQANLPRAPVS